MKLLITTDLQNFENKEDAILFAGGWCFEKKNYTNVETVHIIGY